MQVRTVAIVGLGALGVMYGHHLSKVMPAGSLHIVADENRIEQYRQSGVYCNGELCAFEYWTPGEAETVDLVLVAVKQPGLAGAIRVMKGLVGEGTVVLSLLNGIISEQILAETFSKDSLLLCTAQGMDAVREEREVTYANIGWLMFGDFEPGPPSEKAKSVAAFMEDAKVPHKLVEDMNRRLWSKFMLNSGVKSGGGGLREGVWRYPEPRPAAGYDAGRDARGDGAGAAGGYHAGGERHRKLAGAAGQAEPGGQAVHAAGF